MSKENKIYHNALKQITNKLLHRPLCTNIRTLLNKITNKLLHI